MLAKNLKTVFNAYYHFDIGANSKYPRKGEKQSHSQYRSRTTSGILFNSIIDDLNCTASLFSNFFQLYVLDLN